MRENDAAYGGYREIYMGAPLRARRHSAARQPQRHAGRQVFCAGCHYSSATEGAPHASSVQSFAALRR